MLAKLAKIRNERIRGKESGGNHKESPEKDVELVWACSERREELYAERKAMEMEVQVRRKRSMPKRRWLDKVKDDIKEKGLQTTTKQWHGTSVRKKQREHSQG